MLAEDLLKQGRLTECVTALENAIRKDPADPKLRVFFFQVQCVLGNWERALTQLGVVCEMDPKALLMGQACRAAINCEVIRERVYAGETTPLVLGEPEAWVGWMIQALAMDAQGKADAAAELRTKALDAAPTTTGTIETGADPEKLTSTAFEWIADTDLRIGPMLEAIVDGKLYWIPFSRITLIRIEKPTDLRDMVWAPANFVWASGGQGVGFIPVRYPGTQAQGVDDKLRLARASDLDSDPPLGQRVFGTDAGEFDLLAIRNIKLNPPLA
ncbi:MAG: virulence protein SciE type [Planctomycetes bacterium]|nr:virulence protein SciE type [Planctomycetota bacterium]